MVKLWRKTNHNEVEEPFVDNFSRGYPSYYTLGRPTETLEEFYDTVVRISYERAENLEQLYLLYSDIAENLPVLPLDEVENGDGGYMDFRIPSDYADLDELKTYLEPYLSYFLFLDIDIIGKNTDHF